MTEPTQTTHDAPPTAEERRIDEGIVRVSDFITAVNEAGTCGRLKPTSLNEFLRRGECEH